MRSEKSVCLAIGSTETEKNKAILKSSREACIKSHKYSRIPNTYSKYDTINKLMNVVAP